ncbi:MAG: hypothetical protein H6828_04535 [Planctomycetes bacterium]|nr:hypothetical protein [Planctomycetota bacterium]
MRSSAGEAWARFLDELEGRAAALSEALSRCGKLVEFGGGRAVVRLSGLKAADRAMVQDARNQKLCTKVFSDLMGERVELRLEDSAAVRPGDQDAFTSRVASLFDGKVEDDR